MVKKRLFGGLIIASILIFVSCNSNHEHEVPSVFEKIEDNTVRNLLEKAIESAGGWEAWQNKKQINFDKYVALYDSTGMRESNVWQEHLYTYQTNTKVSIKWEKDSIQYETIGVDGKVERRKNHIIDTMVNATSLMNGILSATFVISLPFKLLDEGVQLTYKGEKTIEHEHPSLVLQAVYPPNSEGQQDIWEIYFDAEDYKMLGYQVQHNDHISYVFNESFNNAGGFLFPHHRKSWRVNKHGEKLYLRATYEYKNYKVE